MESLMQVLESTMAARDPYTVGHQRRVSQIACSIAREMGLSGDRLDNLRIAGVLHDLGKFALPSDLLSKPGKLTTPEFALIKTHPQVAYNILSPITLPGNTALIILQHHERLNGSGYPQGLKGDEILLEARILGVADVMEAMCSHRPYRASLGLAETMHELTSNQGILYDAAVVETCVKLFGQDLPEFGAENAGAQGCIARVRALPEAAAVKPARGRKLGYRSWLQIGSASLMAWLIMASVSSF
jgi:HD-GYP domain-containing protein (c-di-GMP phosphodiesterase class II)